MPSELEEKSIVIKNENCCGVQEGLLPPCPFRGNHCHIRPEVSIAVFSGPPTYPQVFEIETVVDYQMK